MVRETFQKEVFSLKTWLNNVIWSDQQNAHTRLFRIISCIIGYQQRAELTESLKRQPKTCAETTAQKRLTAAHWHCLHIKELEEAVQNKKKFDSVAPETAELSQKENWSTWIALSDPSCETQTSCRSNSRKRPYLGNQSSYRHAVGTSLFRKIPRFLWISCHHTDNFLSYQ